MAVRRAARHPVVGEGDICDSAPREPGRRAYLFFQCCFQNKIKTYRLITPEIQDRFVFNCSSSGFVQAESLHSHMQGKSFFLVYSGMHRVFRRYTRNKECF